MPRSPDGAKRNPGPPSAPHSAARHAGYALVLVAALVLAAPASAQLFRSVTIDDEVVRLGDLFDRAPTPDKIVGRAPAPGQRLVFRDRQLRELAAAHGVAAAVSGHLVVERASRLIEPAEIEAAVAAALFGGAVPPDREIELAGGALRLHVAEGGLPEIEIAQIQHDERSGQFSAILAVRETGGSGIRRRIAGRVVQTIEVPVLARPMRPGERIAAGDVVLVRLRADRLAQNALRDPDALIGQTPRRMLRADAPLNASDVAPPVLVEKGSLVSALLATARMQITARVRAAEDGALGETVALVNPRSNRALEGIVTGPGQVTVAHHPLSAR